MDLGLVIAGRLQASHWQERVSAAEALTSWPPAQRSPQHLDALMKVLVSDDKGFVRAAAATALAHLLAGKTDIGPELWAALAKAANHESEPLSTVRIEAVRALQSIGGSKSREILLPVAKEDPSKRVRDAASQI